MRVKKKKSVGRSGKGRATARRDSEGGMRVAKSQLPDAKDHVVDGVVVEIPSRRPRQGVLEARNLMDGGRARGRGRGVQCAGPKASQAKGGGIEETGGSKKEKV